jgi:hypothetical protein
VTLNTGAMAGLVRDLASTDPVVRTSAADRCCDWVKALSRQQADVVCTLMAAAAYVEDDAEHRETHLNAIGEVFDPWTMPARFAPLLDHFAAAGIDPNDHAAAICDELLLASDASAQQRQLVLPDGFDDDAPIIESKGRLPCHIRLADGDLAITFYDPFRLLQDANAEGAEFCARSVILVERVTHDHLRSAATNPLIDLRRAE